MGAGGGVAGSGSTNVGSGRVRDSRGCHHSRARFSNGSGRRSSSGGGTERLESEVG